MPVKVELNQIRAEPSQIRVYPTPSIGAAEFDLSSMTGMMMSMMQMVLMIVLMLLPIQLLPKILSAIKF